MTIQMHTPMNQVQPLNGDLHTGHMTSSCMTWSQVTKTFTSVTLHRIVIEPWARCHWICLVKTHPIICNTTYLGHLSGQVIWPDLRSNFQINLSGSRCKYVLTSTWLGLTRREGEGHSSHIVTLANAGRSLADAGVPGPGVPLVDTGSCVLHTGWSVGWPLFNFLFQSSGSRIFLMQLDTLISNILLDF